MAWALLLGGLGSAIWDRRGGLVIGICVAAHWFLDLLVHVPDLPLVGDRYKVGFGLWDYPALSFLLEAALLLIAVGVYVERATSPSVLDLRPRHARHAVEQLRPPAT